MRTQTRFCCGGLSARPVCVIAVTTSVTPLHEGTLDRATVRFTNGHSKVIPVESLKACVSVAENPGNAKKVDAVTMEHRSLEA